MPFQIVRNDITKMHTDVIVSPTGQEANVGGGVDRAVYRAAGQEELLEMRRKIGRMNPGEVAETSAGSLACRYIFHACSPVYQDGSRGEERLLRDCYEKCLALAAEKGCESIAFPLLSAGTNGFPALLALETAVDAFRDFLQARDMEIYLVVFDGESAALSGNLFPGVRAYVDEHYVEAALEEEYRGRRRRGLLARRSMLSEDMQETEDGAMPRDGASQPPPPRSVARQAPLPQDAARQGLPARAPAEQAPLPLDRAKQAAPAVYAAAPAAGAAPSGLSDFIRQNAGSFEEYLQKLINRKGMTNAEVYKRANLSKQYFSKVMHGQVRPAKEKLLCIAVALKLNLDETRDFLRLAGFALSPCSKTDLVFEYFIVRQDFDIFSIDIALFDCGLPSLMD